MAALLSDNRSAGSRIERRYSLQLGIENNTKQMIISLKYTGTTISASLFLKFYYIIFPLY